VGGTLAEIVAAEHDVQEGRHPERPFTLVVQPSAFDPTRAPAGVHVGWAYCHVPNGSTVDMTDRIEAHVERFAPGFRDRIVARHVLGPAAMEARNANYVGGDINGGMADLRQFVARPRLGLHPWRTPVDGLYLCSSSTPPGGGVHGMCGRHAAREVLRSQGEVRS
jgi:phytoene dehydrogenase-like protein